MKRIYILMIAFLISTAGFSQYELYNYYYQQQMQQAFNQIQENYSYKCFDGKTIKCFISLAKMSGFNNSTAKISNKYKTKSKSLKVESYNPMTISVMAGEEDWKLSYGDIITIYFDGNNSRTLVVGENENMSEIDWERYANSLRKSSNPSPSNPNPNINPYKGKRSLAQIDLQIKKTKEMIADNENLKNTSTNVVVIMECNRLISENKSMLRELEIERINAQ